MTTHTARLIDTGAQTAKSTKPKTRTITLTDRPPVTIREDQWPQIASAKDWDNTHESQANRTWALRVRQHDDGRAIVYGLYDSQFQNERELRAGELVEADGDIAAAIHRVAKNCNCEQIAQECIADLPAVELE